MKARALHQGSVIRMVSPSSALKPEDTQFMEWLLKNAGYEVTLGTHVYATDGGYLAGPDKDRAADLMEAFLDPSVDAVLCSRGGYGCARLFPYLDFDAIAASGKLLLGFSDITTLHLAINQRGLPSAHTPMAITLSRTRPAWVYDSFLSLLAGKDPIDANAPAGETLTPGTAAGIVTGGCMCLLCDSLATPNPLDAAGKILLIEDVDENAHRIDAMLTHLLNAGVLQQAAGIVIGEMTRTDTVSDAAYRKPWRDIVEESIRPLGIPAVVNYPFGHMVHMLSLPLGIRAELDATNGRLHYTESLFA